MLSFHIVDRTGIRNYLHDLLGTFIQINNCVLICMETDFSCGKKILPDIAARLFLKRPHFAFRSDFSQSA